MIVCDPYQKEMRKGSKQTEINTLGSVLLWDASEMEFRGDLDRKILGLRGPDRICIEWVLIFVFLFRRARKCTKENLPKMGEFTFSPRKWPHRRSLRGHARWQNAHQATRGALRRAIGEFQLSLHLISLLNHDFYCSAPPYKRQNAYPLPGKRGQGTPVFARTARAFRKYGLSRYRRRQPKTKSWPHLDHYP